MFEFSYDQLCGGHMQELNAPGVGDTMGDIISAGIGGLIFAFSYAKSNFSKLIFNLKN